MTDKQCSMCCEVWPPASFYPDKSKKDGLSSRCRKCQKRASAERYAADPETAKAKMAEWQRDNKEVRASYRWRDKLALIKAYGGQCVCCHESAPEFLTIDHVGGWGKNHRRDSGYGYNMVSFLKKAGYPQDGTFRLLCFNCNCSLGIFGRCPHEED